MNTPTGSKGGAKLPKGVLKDMGDAIYAAQVRGYFEPDVAQAAWEASPGPGLVEAVRPFILFAEFLDAETEGFSDTDELDLSIEDHILQRFKVADFRAVRLALSALSPTEPGQIKGGEDE